MHSMRGIIKCLPSGYVAIVPHSIETTWSFVLASLRLIEQNIYKCFIIVRRGKAGLNYLLSVRDYGEDHLVAWNRVAICRNDTDDMKQILNPDLVYLHIRDSVKIVVVNLHISWSYLTQEDCVYQCFHIQWNI